MCIKKKIWVVGTRCERCSACSAHGVIDSNTTRNVPHIFFFFIYLVFLFFTNSYVRVINQTDSRGKCARIGCIQGDYFNSRRTLNDSKSVDVIILVKWEFLMETKIYDVFSCSLIIFFFREHF